MTAQRSVRAADLPRAIPGSQEAHESLVQAALTFLTLHRIPAMPIHTGARFTPIPGGGWRLYGNPKQHGMGDILGCLPPTGRMLLIDCKTGRAQLSPVQRKVHQQFTAAGALALVVRDVAQLETDLAPWLNPRAIIERRGSA